MNVNKIVAVIIVFLTLTMSSGCSLFRDEIVVNNDRVAIKIDPEGAFINKGDFINLMDGESVKYTNKYKGKYYLPSKYIVKENGLIRLKQETDK